MNEYVISESFDMENKEAWIMSGKADSAEEFAKNEMIEGYDMYVTAMDVAFIKYHTGESYMIFCID